MAYKFQIGSAIVSGSLTRDSGDFKIRNHANQLKATIDVSGNATFEGDLDAVGDLTAGTVTMTGFTVDNDGDLVAKSIKSTSVLSGATIAVADDAFTVSNGGAVSASLSMAMHNIAMAEFTVAANGDTDIDGTLNVQGVPTFQAGAVFSSGITTAGAIAGATTISGSGLAQFGQVRADGGLTSQGLDILSGARALGNVTTVSGSGKGSFLSLALDSVDVTATAAELNYLDNDDLTAADITKLAAISATAAEINYLDNDDLTAADLQKLADVTATAAQIDFNSGVTAGTAAASKTLVLDANKDIASIGQLTANGLTGSLRFSLDVAANGGVGMTPFQNTANVNDLKISGSFMAETGPVVATEKMVALSPSGSVKQFSLAAYATAIAGAGLTATNGVLSTDGGAVASWSDGTAFAEGYNYATGSDGGSALLPASPSVGDAVTVKNSSAGSITIGTAGSHDIDGSDSIILESPHAAVTMVYMVADKWKIV